MSESIGFDRAAAIYDRTRALPPDIVERQAALLMAQLGEAELVLEIGVGTGRIALTLDVPVIGLDLSRAMMEVLRSKSATVPLVEGDATTLPFPDGCFGAAYGAHVFHLIPTWETAFAELVRVVRPGGVILAVRGSGRSDVGHELDAAVGIRQKPVGAHQIEEVDDAARRLGLGVRALDTLAWTEQFRIAEAISSIETADWSGLWHLTTDELRVAADTARTWATERFGSADAVVPANLAFAWHAYDVP